MEREAGPSPALELGFTVGRVVVQYRPAEDPVGRHWDEGLRRIKALYPNLTDESWYALETPVMAICEGTEEETLWYVVPVDTRWGLVGTVRSMNFHEQVVNYLNDKSKSSLSIGVILALHALVSSWPAS